MIYWAPFLHLYQPPIQFHKVLRKICDESYRPLLGVLGEHANARVSVNICAVLTEMLHEHNGDDIIEMMRARAGEGKIEFVDSAKFHPILPLIPPQEMVRQIKLNNQTNKDFFGANYRPRGFFPPEMCYSQKVGNCLISQGYEWVLLSGISHPEHWPLNFISSISQPQGKLNIFYRDDIISNKISFREFNSADFINALNEFTRGDDDIYLITAMDAETFGHHLKNWEKNFLSKTFQTIEALSAYHARGENSQEPCQELDNNCFAGLKGKPQIEVVTISQLMDKFTSQSARSPKPSSWSTNKEDMRDKNYYPLWLDKGNRIHRLQWRHMELCWELVHCAEVIKAHSDESRAFCDISRVLLDKALHSCQFWWANKSRGLWSSNLIYKGLQSQEETILNAYQAIKIAPAGAHKKDCYYKMLAARKIAGDIKDLFLELD
jgi:hypothetical protein